MEKDGVSPDEVILSPARAREKKLTSTVTFPVGNLAPEGAVIKSTAIDPSVIDPDGVYRKRGTARVFITEKAAVAAIKGRGDAVQVHPGEIVVLMCRGPLGSGMEETYQVTSALKHLKWGKHVAVITDARFSGVSTGACIGHVGPEALAGGPIGKLRDGDLVDIQIDTRNLTGSLDFIGTPDKIVTSAEGAVILEQRSPAVELVADADLPDDTRMWALLQQLGGGTWGGCVYDVDALQKALQR